MAERVFHHQGRRSRSGKPIIEYKNTKKVLHVAGNKLALSFDEFLLANSSPQLPLREKQHRGHKLLIAIKLLLISNKCPILSRGTTGIASS